MPLVQIKPGQMVGDPTGSNLAHNWGIIAAHINALRRRLDHVEGKMAVERSFRDQFIDWLDLYFNGEHWLQVRLRANILAGFDGAQGRDRGLMEESSENAMKRVELVKEDDMSKRKHTERDIYMVSIGPSGSVFVKTLEFFREQEGFTQKWGEGWKPVVATNIEDAREHGCELPGARPYERQAKP